MDTEIDGTRPAGRKMPALVIANRHEIAGAGIEALLQVGGYSVIARCSHEDELLRFVEAYRPDIIVLAENIVGQEAAKAVLRLRARTCSVAIIFLLDEHEAMTTVELLGLDVEGILLSTACAVRVIDCVESVLHRHKWVDPNLATVDRFSQIANSLTSREAELAHLVSRGLRNKEIARELHLSEGTVKIYLHHIYRKLGLGGRTQLATGAHVSMPVAGHQARPLGEPARPDVRNRLLYQPETSALSFWRVETSNDTRSLS
jgi:two-component system nitrate/nitrite response regulator NarL